MSDEPAGPVRALWAATRLHVWPGRYRLASLDTSLLAEASRLLSGCRGAFAALVLERDEVSLSLPEDSWLASPLRARARGESGPLRAISLDLDLDLGICGYLAPAAARLAQAGVSIVPQCAYLKDHLLVADADLAAAVATLEQLIASCR